MRLINLGLVDNCTNVVMLWGFIFVDDRMEMKHLNREICFLVMPKKIRFLMN